MARKKYSEEDILRLLREIEAHFHGGMDVMSASPHCWYFRQGLLWMASAVWWHDMREVKKFQGVGRRELSAQKRFWQSLSWIS